MSVFSSQVSTSVDGVEDSCIQWPSADAHLRPSTDSDITYLVTVPPCSQPPAVPQVKARSSLSPPIHREPFCAQPGPYVEGVSPVSVPKRDPDKELTMDEWDPMKDDFESKTFNSYNSGPVAGLSGRQDTNMSQRGADNWHRIFIGGLPKEMSEDGLANLVGQVCQVSHVKVINPTEEGRLYSYGFCNVSSANDMQKVIARLDGFVLKGRAIRVTLAKPKDRDSHSGGPTHFGGPTSGSNASSPRESTKTTLINNNTMQNRPVTPRSLENRYGKAKSPPSSRTGLGDAPSPGNQTTMQNGSQSSGDEIKQSALDMVPLAVTRKMHNDQMEGAMMSGAAGGLSVSTSPKDAILPSKGRGQVLQSMLSGTQPQHVGLSHEVSNKELDKEHDNMQHGREQQSGVDHKIEHDRESENTQQGREHDSVQQGREHETMQQIRKLSTKQQSEVDHKINGGRESENMQQGRKQDNTQQDTEQNNIQQGREHGNMQQGSKHDNMQHAQEHGKVQQGKEHGNTQQPAKGHENEQPHKEHDRNSDIGLQIASGARIHANPEGATHSHKSGNKMKLPSTGRGRALETMLDSRYQPLDRKRDIPDLRNTKTGKLAHRGAGEPSGVQDALPFQGPPDHTRVPHHNIAHVLNLEERSPQRPYRDFPDAYPDPRYMQTPYGYGPGLPPWLDDYYGYYRHNAPPMDYWRPPPRRPPFHPERIQYYDFPPRHHVPRRPRPFAKQHRGPDNQLSLVQYKRQPYRSGHGGRWPYPKETLPRSPRNVQIRELSKTPSPSRGKLGTDPEHSNSSTHQDHMKADKASLDPSEPAKTVEAPSQSMPNGNVSAKINSITQKTNGTEVETRPPQTVLSESQTATTPPLSKIKQEPNNDGMKKEISEVAQQKAPSSSPTKSPSPSKHGKDEKVRRRPCTNCGNLGTSKCSKCKTPYCTRECQSKHWPKHKLECFKIGAGDASQSQEAKSTSAPPRDMKTPSPASQMFANKPAHFPHPQASAVYGRFLAKDVPVEKPEEQNTMVLVTEVESPECIYMQLIQRSSCLAYFNLKKLMNSTYPGVPTAKELHFYLTQVGELCAAEVSNEWHRAEILSVNNPEQGVDVMLVDFGQRKRVLRSNLKKLKEEMVKLPKQGVKCFLTGIRPAENDGRWSLPATDLLKSRIISKECRVEFKDHDDKKGYEINLFATKSASASVSEELILADLAKCTIPSAARPTRQSVPSSDEHQRVSVLDSVSEGSKLSIQLGHIASMDIIFGNLAQYTKDIVEMQETLNTPGVVNDSDRTYFLPNVGQLVAARYTEDKHWYRAKVNSITTPDKCSVQFVDYGNREEIAIRDCQELPAQFQGKLFQAVRLVLAGIERPQSGWSEDIEMAFRTWICEGEVEAMVVRKHEDHLEVELFSPNSPDPQMSFNSILADAGFTQARQATPDQSSETGQRTAQADTASAPNQSPKEVLHGMVVWINDPSSFFIQIQEDIDVITALQADLNTCYANSKNDTDYTPALADVCAALFEGLWYRAIVCESMSPISTKVFFMDFGNEDIIENDNIRPIKAQFRDIPAKALWCGLHLAPSGGQWADNALAVMKQKVHEKWCTVYVKRVVDNQRLVEIECEGEDVGKELVDQAPQVGEIKHPAAQPSTTVQPPPPPAASVQIPVAKMPLSDFKALVSWVNSPAEIYIQIVIDENIKAYQELEMGLQAHYEPLAPSTYQPQLGEICVAKSPEHGIWLRARVTAVKAPNCYRVLYLDYGNEEDVTGNVHKIEEMFCQLTIMAVPCSLAGVSPSDGSQWSAQATEFLKEKIVNEVVDVSVSIAKTNSITISKEGKNVAQMLLEAGRARSSPVRTAQSASTLEKSPAPVTSPPPVASGQPKSVPTQILQTPAAKASAPVSAVTPPVGMVKPVIFAPIKPPVEKFKAAMTHINNPSDMYIHISITENIKAFQELEVKIYDHCQTTTSSELKLSTGDVCIAKCNAYGGWYRAQITESHKKGFVKVHFVDYGNDEEVKTEDVRPMLEQFAKVPAMAVHCSLAGVCPPGGGKTWNKEATAYVKNKMENEILEAKVIESSASTCAVDFAIPQRNAPPISISKELIKTGLAKDPAYVSSPSRTDTPNASTTPIQSPRQVTSPGSNVKSPGSNVKSPGSNIKSPGSNIKSPGSNFKSPPRKDMQGQRSFSGDKSPKPSPVAATASKRTKLAIPSAKPPGTEFEGRICVVNHPADFYISLQVANKDNEDAMQKLKSELNAHYSNSPNYLYKPEVGDFVVANRKDVWGRAKVIEVVRSDEARLLFVDYGMKDVVHNTKIHELEGQFAQLPMMALHCCIADIISPGKKPWTQETINTVREKILGCKCRVHVKSTSPKSDLHFVELLVTMKNGNPLDVREEMIKYKLAVPVNTGRNQKGRSPDQRASHEPAYQLKSPQGKSQDLNQSPSGGAFQKYQKSPSLREQQAHGSKSPNTKIPKSPEGVQPPVQRSPMSSVPPKPQIPASREFRGIVSWFNNPGSFYIQVAEKENIEQMGNMNSVLASSYAAAAKASCKPAIGEMIMAEFNQDCCRAVVENISGDSAVILYIDYGNKETVKTSGIRKITDELSKMPVMALHCSLAGVASPDGRMWSRETIEFIKAKVFNQLCQVHVTDASSEVCMVKLFLQEGDGHSFDVKEELITKGFAVESTSVTTSTLYAPITGKSPDYLSSRGLAIKFPDQEADYHDRSITDVAAKQRPSPSQGDHVKKNLVSLPKLPLPSSEFQAVVVVVNNPGNFYIHIASEANAHTITNLGADLNSYYSKSDAKCFKPQKGELCAAQFSQDNGWYRATAIREMSSSAMKVAFVDFGNEEEVRYDVIKELNEEFLKVPVMAQHCCLAGVLPSEDQSGCWSKEVTKYMISKVMDSVCRVRVVDSSTYPVSVELVYGQQGANPTNLAEELLQKNMAKHYLPTRKGATSGPSPIKPLDTMSSPQDASVRPKQVNRAGVKKMLSAQIQCAQLPEGAFQGVLSWITNPGNLFLQAASKENTAIVEKLAELPGYYGNTGPSQYRPVIGSPCAALYQATGDWCRAVALDYVSRDQIKVQFIDYGNSDVVGSEHVHKLEDRFIVGIPALAAHCALSGIEPAGSQWSKEATLFISQYIDKPSIVKVIGRREGIPGVLVEITPTTDDNKTSINQQLITKGLARATQYGEPTLPTPAATSVQSTSKSPTVPTPTTNGFRSASRASIGSSGSDVDALHTRVSEQEEQIRMQQRALEEQNRQIQALQEMMMTQLGLKADK